jgi:hypothetical protein
VNRVFPVYQKRPLKMILHGYFVKKYVMKKQTALLIGLIILLCSYRGFSQKTDTVIIDASKVNTKVLKPGTNRYLVYFKNGKDSSRIKYQVWTRKIDFLTYKNKEAISVTQEWEDNDSIIHTVYAVCDRKSFAPFYHEAWWKRATLKFDFIEKTGYFRDTLLTDNETPGPRKTINDAFKKSLDQYVLNWHLDLEVFPILPYKLNTTFLINFYDPGSSAPKLQAYTVTGSGTLTGYDAQSIDCWLLFHEGTNNKEVFWVSKKTNEVLKLEQEFGGKYRYKVKLGFSV